MSKTILGVDEAGRGAVVGPLVISAAVFEENKIKELEKMGVKDSKKLSRSKREELEDRIKEVAEDFAVVHISAEEIDELMENKSLNRIESEKMSEMLEMLKPDVAIVDATEAKTDKIEKELKSQLEGSTKEKVEIIAENKADENYPPVSAASILAKTARDRAVRKLERKLEEEIGIGYPSDSKTIDFLERQYGSNGSFHDCVRESWVTAERIVEENEQDGLSKFCDVEKGDREDE